MAFLPFGPASPARAVLATAVLLLVPAAAAARPPLRVLVELDVPAAPAPAAGDPQAAAARRSLAARTAASLVARITAGRVQVRRTYRELPFVALEVDEAALGAIVSSREAADVRLDRAHAPSLDATTVQIGADRLWRAGLDGAGASVAVLDTGVDAMHPFLAGKVVHEACFAGSGDCPNGSSFDEGPGAARPCTFSGTGCRHGTLVAGIIAGRGPRLPVGDAPAPSSLPGGPGFGVAPGVELVAVQVFSPSFDCAPGEAVPCPRTYTSDYLAALDWLLERAGELRVAAVNLSFGRDAYARPEDCDRDDPATRFALARLRAAGVAPVVAAGNGGEGAALASPGCLSSAISVGAIGPDGGFAEFSNRAWFLSLAAPGMSVSSSVPGGDFVRSSGTSLAAPHAAAAFAILRQQDPAAPVDGLLTALQRTGPVAEPGEPFVPTIDLPAALEFNGGACPCRTGVDNFCHYPPDECGMTAAGGYCDPDGDGHFSDADWDLGYVDYFERCSTDAPAPRRRGRSLARALGPPPTAHRVPPRDG